MTTDKHTTGHQQNPKHWVYAMASPNTGFVCMNAEPFHTYVEALEFRDSFRPEKGAYIMTGFATKQISPESIMEGEAKMFNGGDAEPMTQKQPVSLTAYPWYVEHVGGLGAPYKPVNIHNADGELLLNAGDDAKAAVLASMIVVAVNEHAEASNAKQESFAKEAAITPAHYDAMGNDAQAAFRDARWPIEDWRYEVANDSTKWGFVIWQHQQATMWADDFEFEIREA